MSGWSELLPEIIVMISLQIDNPFDLIHFRSVCSRWRSFSIQTLPPIPSLTCPLALGDICDYFHILKSRVYLVTSLSSDPPRFWLFKVQEESGELSLQALLDERSSSRRQIFSFRRLSIDLLNSQVTELVQEHVACYTFGYDLFSGSYSPYKREVFCISFLPLDADNKEFVVLGRLSFKCLGMYRSFEDRWTEIETTPGSSPDGITSFNGQFYVIDTAGVTKVIKPTLEVYSFQRSRPCRMTRRRWFVKAEDKLLLVEMCTDYLIEYQRPRLLAKGGWFEVSELNEDKNDWIQMEDAGGRILFLEKNCSFSCLPNQIPGFRPNSIIFEDMFGYYLGQYQVFEFGVQGFRPLEDIPEYTQHFPSSSWIASSV